MDDDCFHLFEFRAYGLLRDWECTLKHAVDCQTVLVAGTAIARHAILLTATELRGKRIESDEWFEKAAAVLHFIATDRQIGYALCEAHFQHEPAVYDSLTGGDTQISRLFEHNAATWHELVGKVAYCYAHNCVPGNIRFQSNHRRTFSDRQTYGSMIQHIDSQLKAESTHARRILTAQSISSKSCLVAPLNTSYARVLKTFRKLSQVIARYINEVLEIFTTLNGEWDCTEEEDDELRFRLATSEDEIFELVANAQMALDSLPIAPRIIGRVALGGGLFAESHAAALLAMGHGIIGVLNHEHAHHVGDSYGVYYFDSGIFELSYKWMHFDNLIRIDFGMSFEFMQAAAEATVASPVSASAITAKGYLGIRLNVVSRIVSRDGVDGVSISLSDRPWGLLMKFVRAESIGVSSDELKSDSYSDSALKQAISDLRGNLTGLGLNITDGRGGKNRMLISTSETSDDDVSG